MTLKILFALQMGKEGNDLVKFVSVVWPRAMHFLSCLQEHIFLFTVSGSETTTKPVCHLLIVRERGGRGEREMYLSHYIYIYIDIHIYICICSELWEPGLGFQICHYHPINNNAYFFPQ